MIGEVKAFPLGRDSNPLEYTYNGRTFQDLYDQITSHQHQHGDWIPIHDGRDSSYQIETKKRIEETKKQIVRGNDSLKVLQDKLNVAISQENEEELNAAQSAYDNWCQQNRELLTSSSNNSDDGAWLALQSHTKLYQQIYTTLERAKNKYRIADAIQAQINGREAIILKNEDLIKELNASLPNLQCMFRYCSTCFRYDCKLLTDPDEKSKGYSKATNQNHRTRKLQVLCAVCGVAIDL